MILWKGKSYSKSTHEFCYDNTGQTFQRVMESCDVLNNEEFVELTQCEVKDMYAFNQLKEVVFAGLSPGMENLTPILNSVIRALMKTGIYQIFLSGSAGELYIRPRRPCVNDIDLICKRKDCVAVFDDAFSDAHVDFCHDTDTLERFKIISKNGREVELDKRINPRIFSLISDAFVSHVSENGMPVQHDHQNHWIQMQYQKGGTVLYEEWRFVDRSSSAVTLGLGRQMSCMTQHQYADSAVDFVEMIQCLNWPTEIKEWLDRERRCDWPDEDTRKKVIRGGCQIISMPEIANRTFCKISFSRAEQVLINSWNPVQQIVYHMLRFVSKATLFKSSGLITITNYHLKTLMFWKCEECPAEYWFENSVVFICCNLLADLKSRILNRELRNYFLGFNMFLNAHALREESFDYAIVALIDLLDEFIDENNLKTWFDVNYFQRWNSSISLQGDHDSEQWELVYERI